MSRIMYTAPELRHYPPEKVEASVAQAAANGKRLYVEAFERTQELFREGLPHGASVFPAATALLERSTHNDPFRYVFPLEVRSRYLDEVDCLLCELFPEFKPAYDACVRDEGAQLREDGIDVTKRNACERTMLLALAVARQLYNEFYPHCEETPIPYQRYLDAVREAARGIAA